MKPFDLEKALAGEPVQLRNGRKAYVLRDLRDLFDSSCGSKRCLIGVYAEEGNPSVFGWAARWKLSGKHYESIQESEFDIVWMWEEPKLTKHEILDISRNEGKSVMATYKYRAKVRFVVVGESTNGILIVMTEDGDLRYITDFNINDAELELE